MKKVFRSASLMLFLLICFSACPEPGTNGPMDNAGALVNSVWAGETPRPGDWLTITFKPEAKVVWSFSLDNTTNEWDYTFDTVENNGTIDSGESWNPDPDGFTINGDTLTVTNYGDHGEVRDFKRYR